MNPTGIKFGLGVGFALVLALMLSLTMLGLKQMEAINDRLVAIVTVNDYKTELVTMMRDALRDRTITMHSLVLNTAPFEQNDELYDFHQHGARFAQAMQAMSLSKLTAQEKTILAQVRTSANLAQPLVTHTVDLALEKHNREALGLLQNSAIPAQKTLTSKLSELLRMQREANADAVLDAFDAYLKTRSLMIGMGSLAGLIGLVIAVIAIRRTAQQTSELEKQKLKYQTLFETNSDAIVIVNEKGFSDCNPATLKMFGIPTVADFIACQPHQLGAPIQDNGQTATEFAAECVARARKTDYCFFEWRGIRADGTEFPSEIALHAMTLNGKRVVQAIMRDITERKQAEQSIKAAHDAAVQAARLKTEFVANVSHEIRTPMNGVLGMANLMLKTTLSPQQREYAQAIHSSGKSLLTIINDILDFSRIDAGKLTIESIDFNLHETVLEIASLFVNRAEEKKLAFDCNIQAGVPEQVRGDPGRLRQILVNLLDNALKFTDAGLLQIRVATTAEKPPGPVCEIVFTVEDSGIGMTPDTQSRLFRSFSQADGSTTRKYGGAGLGLAICKQLVELMGGKIDVTSVVGKGSCFRFSIPLICVEPVTAPDIVHTQHEAAPSGSAMLAGKQILVVEDNVVNQKVMLYLLRHFGASVDIAANGREAATLAQSRAYHLILMDCQMPVMDGYQASLLIRRTSPSIPIIAMTANAMQGTREQCLAAGMNDYLAKPVHEEELIAMLVRWLDCAAFPQEQQTSGNAPDTDTASDHPVNLPALQKNCKQNAALVSELLNLYCSSTAPLLIKLGAGIASHSAASARAAHEIKGASAYIAAVDAQRLANMIEKEIKAQQWETASNLFADLEAAFIRVQLFVACREASVQ